MGDRPIGTPDTGRALPKELLSPQAVALFGKLAQGQQPGAEDAQALAELRAWGMASGPDGGAHGVVAMPPVTAAWTVAQQGLLHLQDQIQRLVELPRTVEQLDTQFAKSRFRAGAGSEYLEDVDEVNERIGQILSDAREELLGAHPYGPRTRAQMEVGIPRDTAALERGVRYRTLYQDVVRDDPVTCEWASVMSARGVHFRTLADPFERVIIVDRRVAVISNYVVPDAPSTAAWIITDRAMVAYAAHAFDQQWRRGRIWSGERRVRGAEGGQGRLSEMQAAILRALSEGDSQDGTARRLQMSTRTLQRELDAIRRVWALPNATVAQLTFRWALSPERAGTLEQERDAA